MKTLLLIVLTLTISQAQARNGNGSSNDDGENYYSQGGCELKVNRTKIFFKDAVIGSPVVVENQQYKMTMLYTGGRIFEATLLDKTSGDLAKLSNDASGNLMGSLVSDEDTANAVNITLPASGREVHGRSSSGDSIKLEKGTRGTAAKAELKLVTDEAPNSVAQLECFY